LRKFKYTYNIHKRVIIISRHVRIPPLPLAGLRVVPAFIYIVSFTWGKPHVLINLYSRSLAATLQCFAGLINKLYTCYVSMSDEK